MSPEQDLWRLRRSSSFVFSWVILCLPGEHQKWPKLRYVFVEKKKHWCEWKAQMRTRWPHAACPIKTHLVLVRMIASRVKGFQLFLSSLAMTSCALQKPPWLFALLAEEAASWTISVDDSFWRHFLVKRTFTLLIEAMCSVRPLKFKWCLPLCVPLMALKVLIKESNGNGTDTSWRRTERQNQLHPKNRWQCQTKKTQISNQKATWLKLSKSLKCIGTWLFLY